MITKDGATRQVPIAFTPAPVVASHEAIEAAKTAPAAHISAEAPPALPPKVDFNRQIETAVRANARHDQGFLRPTHWDYIDYDDYRRPRFFNPLDTDVSFRYFYAGQYRTVFVPAGAGVLLDAATVGVFPFTVAAGELVSVGSFLGGAWIPPVGWDGPPPADWVPWSPVVYDQVPAYFPATDQTVAIDRITMVGHDDSAPAGQQDVFQLNDSTLGRGQVTPAPDGGPPQITVAQTQPLPGVSQWNDGKQYVNTQVTPLAAAHRNLAPWILCGVAAVLAALAGIAAWVWKHPRGAHTATADATTEMFDPVSH